MDCTKYLIVGAGVTGLSFADSIESDDYLICEAGAEIGGYCKTIEQDGFTWDYSGHFFHFKDPELEKYLVDRMGDQRVRPVEKVSRIDYQGHQVDFPFQKNIHQLSKEEFIECLVGVYFKEGFEGEGEPRNFKEMLYAKFGRGIAEKFLIPYNEKLYATDLAKLDVDAMGRFFPYANLDQIIGNMRPADADNASYNATFTYPEGGAIQYVKAMAAGVDADRICLNERVESIDLKRKVAVTNKREISFEYVISSTPFVNLLDMTGIPYDPSTYSWNKVLVFNMGFDRKGPEGVHWIYYPSKELCFYRLGFYDNIFGTDRMSMYVELGYPADAVVDEEVVETQRQQVLKDLEKCGVVDGHELVSWHTVTLDPAYVHITKESVSEVDRLKQVLAARGIYSAGRYGSWTYCSIEDNMIEARRLAAMFNALPA